MIKVFLSICAGGMLLFGTAAGWAAESAQKKAEAEVTKLVHEIVAARTSPDVDFYFTHYSENLSTCCFGSTVWSNKQAFYKSWKAGVDAGGGVSKAEATGLRVQGSPAGDSVIATYVMKCVRRKPPEGQPPEYDYNITEIWVKRDNKWQVENLTFSQYRAGGQDPATAAAKSGG